MAVRELTDATPDGSRAGQTATEKLGFHGATPVAQAAFVASTGSKGSSSNIIVASLSGFVFANSSVAAQLIAVVEALRVMAVTKGLMAAS